MLRVVLDANVFISGLLSERAPQGQMLDAWLKKQLKVFDTNTRQLSQCSLRWIDKQNERAI